MAREDGSLVRPLHASVFLCKWIKHPLKSFKGVETHLFLFLFLYRVLKAFGVTKENLVTKGPEVFLASRDTMDCRVFLVLL